jgi:DNA primase
MPGRIRSEDIAAVRERSPIADVIGEYLQLRPAGGGSLKGLCPFHDEKSPSFNVTPGRELYYCHGCGKGGDVIRFVEEIDHLTFAEAIERLAARAKIELRYEQGGYVPGQETSIRRRLIEAHRVAEEFFAAKLREPAASHGRAFLSERGFDAAAAEQFGVGYSPASWEDLTRHLRGRGFTDEELTKSGLSRAGRRGLVDMFRNRLMWPIRDLTGETVAFGARKLDPEADGPKYLNTSETILFKKGHVLYGADLAKREIAHRRQAVIVEGYTDVMACHLAGVPTAVATCGTSFGEDHVKVLRRLIMDTEGADGEVIFTFDGDAAGQRAALRAFSLEDKFVTQTYVTVQPDGLDPCDLRLKHGDAAVRDLVARRVPLFDFAIRSVLAKHNLDTTIGQMAALDEAAPIVARIKRTDMRARYAVNLDRWLGLMDEKFVLSRVRQEAKNPRARSGRGAPSSSGQAEGADAPVMASYDRSDPVVRVEREALKLAIQWPGLCGPEFDALDASAFTVSVHASVFELVAGRGGVVAAGRARDWVDGLLEAAPNDTARTFLTEMAVEPLLRIADETDAEYAAVVLARVSELAVAREISTLKGKLQRMNPLENDEYNRLFGDLMALEVRHRELRDRATGGYRA